MIKRDGVKIMNARTKNLSLAKETIQICKDREYTSLSGKTADISDSLDAAIQGTVLYPDFDLATYDFTFLPMYDEPTIEVVNETTAQAAVRLLEQGKENIAALNFAAARNPGGGFLAGAIAQEEDLCRCSGLYPCIKSKPEFYNQNILCDDSYYTDHMIYSPNVPFIRDEYNMLLEETFHLSLITVPAPNVGAMKEVDDQRLIDTLYNRMLKLLGILASHNHETIILGAWGCGAFGNDPVMVATLFEETLKEMPFFKHICFAVYDTRTPPHLFETFKKIFT